MEIGSAAADLAKEASDLEDRYLGDLLTKVGEERQALQSFRDALETLPALLAPPSADNSKQKPLVIIIDELDRCRPDFALQILERIKHFFAVQDVHFILGTHLGQLRNSVSTVYGSGIDSAKYLQKFISFTLHLTESDTQPHRRNSTVYINYLMTSMLPEQNFKTTVDLAKPYYGHLAHHFRLSLRAIEKIISALAISLAYRGEKSPFPDAIIVGLCALKVVSPEIYVRAKSGEPIFHEARVPLGFASTPEPREKHAVEHMVRLWRWFADTSIAGDNPEYKGIGDRLTWETNLERWDVVPHIAHNVVDRLS